MLWCFSTAMFWTIRCRGSTTFVRARRSRKLPVVLTREEVRSLLAAMKGTPRLVAGILYGGGLRLLEALRLRIKDVDFAARLLVVREGKGAKDRRTMLPESPAAVACSDRVGASNSPKRSRRRAG